MDGRDVTSVVATRSEGRYSGAIKDLKDGDNVVTARAGGTRAVSLTITNFPHGGPIIPGAQHMPFHCATPTPTAASGPRPATNASGL